MSQPTTPLRPCPRTLHHSASRQQIMSETAGLQKLSIVKKNLAMFGPTVTRNADDLNLCSPVRNRYPLALGLASPSRLDRNISSESTSSVSTAVTDVSEDGEGLGGEKEAQDSYRNPRFGLTDKPSFSAYDPFTAVLGPAVALAKAQSMGDPQIAALPKEAAPEDQLMQRLAAKQREALKLQARTRQVEREVLDLQLQYAHVGTPRRTPLRTKASFIQRLENTTSPLRQYLNHDLKQEFNDVKLHADEFVNRSISKINQQFNTNIPTLRAPTVDRSSKPSFNDLDLVTDSCDSDFEEGGVEAYTAHLDERLRY